MDRNARRTAPDKAQAGRLRRWLTPQQPQSVADTSEMDLGYESALPWFSDTESNDGSPAPHNADAPVRA
jgi:hypothetical protein